MQFALRNVRGFDKEKIKSNLSTTQSKKKLEPKIPKPKKMEAKVKIDNTKIAMDKEDIERRPETKAKEIQHGEVRLS